MIIVEHRPMRWRRLTLTSAFWCRGRIRRTDRRNVIERIWFDNIRWRDGRSYVITSKHPKLGLTQELFFSRMCVSTTGYTFTPCVGSFTSPGPIDTRQKGPPAFSVSSERHRQSFETAVGGIEPLDWQSGTLPRDHRSPDSGDIYVGIVLCGWMFRDVGRLSRSARKKMVKRFQQGRTLLNESFR